MSIVERAFTGIGRMASGHSRRELAALLQQETRQLVQLADSVGLEAGMHSSRGHALTALALQHAREGQGLLGRAAQHRLDQFAATSLRAQLHHADVHAFVAPRILSEELPRALAVSEHAWLSSASSHARFVPQALERDFAHRGMAVVGSVAVIGAGGAAAQVVSQR